MFPVVKIIWTDATVINDWKTKADLEKDEKEDAAPCTSIGFLIKTTKQFYYVANTVTSGETEDEILSNGIILIPRKWVVSKEEITV
jgi:hypothetical protein